MNQPRGRRSTSGGQITLAGLLVLTGLLVLNGPAARVGAAPAAAVAAAWPKSPAYQSYPVSRAPYLAAYRWGAANPTGGAPANEAFARWLNRKVVWAEDFMPVERWDNNIEGGDWQLGEWSAWKKAVPGRRLVLSVPLLPGGWDRSGPKSGEGAGQPVSWAAAARGDYNVHFQRLAQNLVRWGLGDSILRLGWEFNGGWYTWRAGDAPADFVAYWQQIVKTMRAVRGTEKMQFCWNPALGYLQFPAEQAWPGEEYVDLVGLDVYDASWAKDTYPWPAGSLPEAIARARAAAWDTVIYGGDHGIRFWAEFARTHHRPFCFPEWGVSAQQDGHGGGDDPEFIDRMLHFIREPASGVYFDCYFDVNAGDGHHQLSPGISGKEASELPLSAAVFQKAMRSK